MYAKELDDFAAFQLRTCATNCGSRFNRFRATVKFTEYCESFALKMMNNDVDDYAEIRLFNYH